MSGDEVICRQATNAAGETICPMADAGKCDHARRHSFGEACGASSHNLSHGCVMPGSVGRGQTAKLKRLQTRYRAALKKRLTPDRKLEVKARFVQARRDVEKFMPGRLIEAHCELVD